MKLTVKVPGSCGELLQGSLNGNSFLVTCPVGLYSTVTVNDEDNRLQGLGIKAEMALQKTLEYIGETRFDYGMTLSSELPQSKGMASSSADIAAVCQAAAVALGRELSDTEIAAIAVQIEPTDGVFCNGIVEFNHISGQKNVSFDFLPPMNIAIFDVGGMVDTLRFNQRSDLDILNQEKEMLIREAHALLCRGFEEHDCALIGRAATMSAMANQKILPKPGIEEIKTIALSNGAYGINAAHSGTVLGMLFPDTGAKITAAVEQVREKCIEAAYWGTVKLVSGGTEWKEG